MTVSNPLGCTTNGLDKRIRTFDPLVPSQALYQTELHPDINGRDGIDGTFEYPPSNKSYTPMQGTHVAYPILLVPTGYVLRYSLYDLVHELFYLVMEEGIAPSH